MFSKFKNKKHIFKIKNKKINDRTLILFESVRTKVNNNYMFISNNDLRGFFNDQKSKFTLENMEDLVSNIYKVHLILNDNIQESVLRVLESYEDILENFDRNTDQFTIYNLLCDNVMIFKLNELFKRMAEEMEYAYKVESLNTELNYANFKNTLLLGIDNLLDIKGDFHSSKNNLKSIENSINKTKLNLEKMENSIEFVNTFKEINIEKLKQKIEDKMWDFFEDNIKSDGELSQTAIEECTDKVESYYQHIENTRALSSLDILNKNFTFNLSKKEISTIYIVNNKKEFLFTSSEHIFNFSIISFKGVFFDKYGNTTTKNPYEIINMLNQINENYKKYVDKINKFTYKNPLFYSGIKIIVENNYKNISNFLKQINEVTEPNLDIGIEKIVNFNIFLEEFLKDNFISFEKNLSNVEVRKELEITFTDKFSKYDLKYSEKYESLEDKQSKILEVSNYLTPIKELYSKCLNLIILDFSRNIQKEQNKLNYNELESFLSNFNNLVFLFSLRFDSYDIAELKRFLSTKINYILESKSTQSIKELTILIEELVNSIVNNYMEVNKKPEFMYDESEGSFLALEKILNHIMD